MSVSARKSLLTLMFCCGAAPVLAEQPFEVEVVTADLEHPWSLAFLPEGSYLVTERSGRLRLVTEDGSVDPEPIAGLPDDIHAKAQAGLKDVVLAPDFEDSRQLFLSYACGTESANTTCLASARLADHRLEALEVIFRAEPEREGSVHYGGRILILPDDTLLLTLGDGFSYREQAQNPANHIGKVVRLNADGSIPRDNPFVHDPETRDEIFTLGHRNPQGIVYDADNDRIIAHEHGPRGGDELNILQAGNNHGWPLITTGIDYTGARITPFTSLPGLVEPILTWTPALAPSGMTLYDGFLFPQWQGDLFIGGLAGQSVRRVRLDGSRVVEEETLLADRGERYRDVRTGPHGALYLLVDQQDGRLLRLVPTR